MKILGTTALTYCFGQLKAVDALTISVETNEVFGLLGLMVRVKARSLRC